VAWAGGYQVTGDTMFLYEKQKPDRLFVFENSLVVGRVIPTCNQIKKYQTGILKTGLLITCDLKEVLKRYTILKTTVWLWWA
jgi:hypothetical protein